MPTSTTAAAPSRMTVTEVRGSPARQHARQRLHDGDLPGGAAGSARSRSPSCPSASLIVMTPARSREARQRLGLAEHIDKRRRRAGSAPDRRGDDPAVRIGEQERAAALQDAGRQVLRESRRAAFAASLRSAARVRAELLAANVAMTSMSSIGVDDRFVAALADLNPGARRQRDEKDRRAEPERPAAARARLVRAADKRAWRSIASCPESYPRARVRTRCPPPPCEASFGTIDRPDSEDVPHLPESVSYRIVPA